MATPRPRLPRTSRNYQQEVKHEPQIPMLLDYGVIDRLPKVHKEFLEQTFGMSMFQDFCKLQQAKAEDNLKSAGLLFGQYTTEEVAQLAKDMRLAWRFWTDLLRYAEGFKPSNNRANDEKG